MVLGGEPADDNRGSNVEQIDDNGDRTEAGTQCLRHNTLQGGGDSETMGAVVLRETSRAEKMRCCTDTTDDKKTPALLEEWATICAQEVGVEVEVEEMPQ